MIVLRYLLFPFAMLYGCITRMRNWLYDKGILKSHSFNIPIIAVGNLSVGGTGKTPQIEYLIRLLSPHYKVATLSRGYKRKSSGFLIANANATAKILGDEPFQMHLKFPKITVAVDADRKNGIEKLLDLPVKPEIILLDDAFQHRKVKAGFYILLTAYNDLFCDDFMLPTGMLREPKSGAKRADMIIVTKCPNSISDMVKEQIKKKIMRFLLRRNDKVVPIYFSCISYDDKVYNETTSKNVSEIKNTEKVLLAGIAKPKLFFDYLQSGNDDQLTYPDHHHFTDSDIRNIQEKSGSKLIITTEKDFVRLKHQLPQYSLFYLPIKTEFIANSSDFEATIITFLEN